FAWSLYFAFQSWLAASGKVAWHRTIGMIGVSLATAMTIFGFLVAVNAMKRSAAAGLTDDGIAFAIVPLSGILFFAVVFALAIAAIRKHETHKRLMLLAASGLCLWRHCADRHQAAELADQYHAALAFLRRRHIGDGAIDLPDLVL